MTQVADLSPPIDASENVYVTFDFATEMSAGATVASATVTCLSILGVDPTPSARIIGQIALAPSPSTGAATQAVRQLIGGMIGGERYRLQCVAAISDGQTLNIDTHIDCNRVT